MFNFLGKGLSVAPTLSLPLQLLIFNANIHFSLSVGFFYLNVNNTHLVNSNVIKYSCCRPSFHLLLMTTHHSLANYYTQQDAPTLSYRIALSQCCRQTYVLLFHANPINHYNLSMSINILKIKGYISLMTRISKIVPRVSIQRLT